MDRKLVLYIKRREGKREIRAKGVRVASFPPKSEKTKQKRVPLRIVYLRGVWSYSSLSLRRKPRVRMPLFSFFFVAAVSEKRRIGMWNLVNYQQPLGKIIKYLLHYSHWFWRMSFRLLKIECHPSISLRYQSTAQLDTVIRGTAQTEDVRLSPVAIWWLYCPVLANHCIPKILISVPGISYTITAYAKVYLKHLPPEGPHHEFLTTVSNCIYTSYFHCIIQTCYQSTGPKKTLALISIHSETRCAVRENLSSST